MSHLLSPMEEPLGRAVGNALEVAECIEILQGGGPLDLVKLIIDLAAKVSTTSRSKLEARLKNGSAWKKFVSLVYAQDGDATTLDTILKEHRAPIIHPLPAKKSGVVKKMDARMRASSGPRVEIALARARAERPSPSGSRLIRAITAWSTEFKAGSRCPRRAGP